MRWRFIFAISLAAFSLPSAAQDFQVAPSQIEQPALEMEIDPVLAKIQALQSKLTKHEQRLQQCEERVSSLEDQLRNLNNTLVLSCVAPTVSSNGFGVSEDCGAYTCNSVDGRCRQACTSSDHCAGGFACDIGAGRCISIY